ncbi:MAG: cation:proton antiporter [Kofleriaceae bacterium]|jgi:Kef-type K+ transport system membrane component KefB|nr:cation:proton antiporter [Kofleriaceae bacterium]MBP6839034.1 cation:proton antiporter [Kofleriaceae bacterium]MBP9203846.1 cation:proton antiporter [Kofleriaceae bacterium]
MSPRLRRRVWSLLGVVCLLVVPSLGSSGASYDFLLAIGLALVAAKLTGDLFERAGLPSVLGELSAGIVLGNLDLLGTGVVERLMAGPELAFLGELGVIILLFQVGLESNVAQMAKVGLAAFVVAIVGVILPMGLGFGVHLVLAPDKTWHAHLFIGAVLTATSVGITARVLKDLGKIDTPTGRVVLGAAVIDDVLGLIVLAVVAGIVSAAATGDSLDLLAVLIILGKAVGFLGVAIALGGPVGRVMFRAAGVLRVHGVLLAGALAFCLAVAYGAYLVGLAAIVGAFAAGLVLDEVHYKDVASREDRHLEHELRPLGELLTPMFFVVTGAHVDLAAFADADALTLAAALTVVAILGKQACALVAFGPGIHRPSVGLGMIPRGEVGLIFAKTGQTLMLAGAPVIGSTTYAAVVLMIMITTMVTPPLLAWSLRRAPAPP